MIEMLSENTNGSRNASYRTQDTNIKSQLRNKQQSRQYSSIAQINSEEQQSIIQWIKEKYSGMYAHCQRIKKLEDLFDGIALAEIVSDFLEYDQQQKQIFLNSIEIVDSKTLANHNKQTVKKAIKNMNNIISMVKKMIQLTITKIQSSYQNNMQNTSVLDREILQLCKLAYTSLQKLKGEMLVGNKNKLKSFMIQIVMILPEIRHMFGKEEQGSNRKQQDQKTAPQTSKHYQPQKRGQNVSRFSTSNSNNSMNKNSRQKYHSNIDELSSIVQIIPKPSKTNKQSSTKNKQNLTKMPPKSVERKNSSSTASHKKQIQKPESRYQTVRNFSSNQTIACKQSYNYPNSNTISHQKSRRTRKNSQQQQQQFQIMQQQQQPNQFQLQRKIQKLLSWIQTKYQPQIRIELLSEPHLLIGELVNCVLLENRRLNSNEKIIKPCHFQLGAYGVYKKVINVLAEVQRLNKSNLILFMKQLQQEGQVMQETFWALIEDLYNMSNNKVGFQINYTMRTGQKQKQRSRQKQSKQRKPTTLHTQSSRSRLPTQFNTNDENINFDNIKNQSVGEILKTGQIQKNNNKKKIIKEYSLYQQKVVRQTQIWLQQQMGMSWPLEKSKEKIGFMDFTAGNGSPKNAILTNPLLNGTLFAKILQRLKISSAKGIISIPSSLPQLKSNLQIIKNQLLKRGYQSIRKIQIYKPTYNFYIGLLSEVRQMYESKQSQNRNLISQEKMNKRIRDNQKINLILQEEYEEIERWLREDYKIELDENPFSGEGTNRTKRTQIITTRTNQSTRKHISLLTMKLIIESIIKINLLKQTTQKIRRNNYEKLMNFFRSIGFVHYSNINVNDFVEENYNGLSEDKYKRSQGIRWMILRDLKLIKGHKRG